MNMRKRVRTAVVLPRKRRLRARSCAACILSAHSARSRGPSKSKSLIRATGHHTPNTDKTWSWARLHCVFATGKSWPFVRHSARNEPGLFLDQLTLHRAPQAPLVAVGSATLPLGLGFCLGRSRDGAALSKWCSAVACSSTRSVDRADRSAPDQRAADAALSALFHSKLDSRASGLRIRWERSACSRPQRR